MHGDIEGSAAPHGVHRSRWQRPIAVLRMRRVAWLVGIDLFSILVGLGGIVAAHDALHGATQGLLLLLPLYFVIAINGRAYTSDNLASRFRAVWRGLKSLTIAIAVTVLVGFALKASDNIPRVMAILGFVSSCSLMFVGRYVFTRHFEAIIGGNPFSVVLIHEADQPLPVGTFSIIVAADATLDPEAHDPVMYDRLAKTLRAADRVVVVCRPERRTAWAHVLKGNSVQGEIVVPELGSMEPLGIDRYGSTPTIVVSAAPLNIVERAMKRGFDLTLASGAALLLSPLLAAVAIAVKLDSDGPVLFRQTRIGRDNKMFEVIKFRSMRAELADGDGHRSTARDDDRTTRVGRLIRRTSIDELPQLFNVLLGDMSIVGPRPHALGSRAADKLFWEVDGRYWHRHAIKPGLTGLAQVRGFRGATNAEADLSNRLQADLEYLENWSIWRDVRIILMTFRVILHRNAF